MIKTARQLQRPDPQSLQGQSRRCTDSDAQLHDGALSGAHFSSEYRDKFILKGGMLVAAMVGLDARSTMDIDATVKGATVGHRGSREYDCLHRLRSGGRWRGVPLKRISEIMDEARSAGIRRVWKRSLTV